LFDSNDLCAPLELEHFDTIGQPDAGAMSGGNYSLTGGFWALISVVQMTGTPLLTIISTFNLNHQRVVAVTLDRLAVAAESGFDDDQLVNQRWHFR
jgi:hypothetical protein